MKKKRISNLVFLALNLSLLIFLVPVSTYAAAKYSADASQKDKWMSGLVGYWTFDGPDMDWSQSGAEARDQSGQANHGAVTGFGQEGVCAGKVGQALSFDGSNDWVVIGALGDMPAITISAWIYPYSDGGNNRGRIVDISSRDRFNVNNEAGGTVRLYGENTAMTVDKADSQTSTTIPLDSWSYVVTVYDHNGDKKVHIYIDGQEANYNIQDAADGSRYSNNFPLAIGRRHDISTDYFDGLIDEVRIYDRALTQPEIDEIYNAGAGRQAKVDPSQKDKLTSGLVGYWTFDGPDMDWSQSSAEARDQSGQGNHGDVTNFGQEGVRVGKVGQALAFDGDDDCVIRTDAELSANFPGKNATSNTSYSFAGWFKFDSLAVNEPILRKPSSWQVVGEDENTVEWGLATDGGNTYLYTSTNLQSGTWYHIAGTWNGSYMRLYLNGMLEDGPTARGNTLVANTSPFWIGGVTATKYFDGLIDEVRVYNRALSEDEIEALYNLGERKFQVGE